MQLVIPDTLVFHKRYLKMQTKTNLPPNSNIKIIQTPVLVNA